MRAAVSTNYLSGSMILDLADSETTAKLTMMASSGGPSFLPVSVAKGERSCYSKHTFGVDEVKGEDAIVEFVF